MMRHVLFLIWFILYGGVFLTVSADENTVRKIVPIKYVKEYYPPNDSLSLNYPDFLMDKNSRMEWERYRLRTFIRTYHLDEESGSLQKTQTVAGKPGASLSGRVPKKVKPEKHVRLKRWVLGFYIDRESRLPVVNVNGRFVPVRKLAPGRILRVLSVKEDMLFVSDNRHRVFRIQVGKPLPF